jgi:hypothetical protein
MTNDINPRPFLEETKENKKIRTFSPDSRPKDLVWHVDDENRRVIPLKENDWLYQEDNKLPVKIDHEIIIPKGVYHRIIKGTTELIVEITEY